MSDNIYAKGKLFKVTLLKGETLEQQCERICKEKGILDLGPLYSTWEEGLRDSFNEEYMIINNILYEVKDVVEERDTYDLFHAHKTSTGYEFEVLFHNGGCCLPEAIEYAIDKIEEDND